MSFWAKIAKFSGLRDGLVPASGGGSTNVLFADGIWRSPGALSASALALSQHVLAVNFTVTAGYSAVVSRYTEVSAGITLEIGADGDLEIA